MQTWTGGASIAFVLKRGYLERTYTLTIKSTGTVLYFQDVSWETASKNYFDNSLDCPGIVSPRKQFNVLPLQELREAFDGRA